MASEVNAEGSAWFWKIFGGTIIGMITLLLVTIFGNLRNELSDNKYELMSQINELRSDTRQDRESFSGFKERLIVLEHGYSKDKLQNLDQLIRVLSESINNQKEKIVTIESSLFANKEEIKSIREELKDLTKQVQEVREKVASLTPVVSEQKKENPTTIEKP